MDFPQNCLVLFCEGRGVLILFYGAMGFDAVVIRCGVSVRFYHCSFFYDVLDGVGLGHVDVAVLGASYSPSEECLVLAKALDFVGGGEDVRKFF